ncbi:alpha-E domain-containing protein [Pseudomonas sp. TMP25]|uniref:alpha-E domain-containing protein n=1 Tax=Pseudomonas sp. TMP25 TaxID=3136561 RepID=UPI003100BCB0
MLSRTAASLYWMSRYLERAENLARMLDVSYSLSLMPHDEHGAGLDELAMSLKITGTFEQYQELHGELDADRLLHFFALDGENPGSIYCCLREARSNAHAVRGRITLEMWENINASWLEVREIAEQGLSSYGIGPFCEWVKTRSHLFRGSAYGTSLRNDAFRFMRLGICIERADNTLRLLDSRYEMLGEDADNITDGSAYDYYQWSALLRALSVFEAFIELYRGSPGKRKVVELLILHEDVPRSLRACVGEIKQILDELPERSGRPAQYMADAMDERLRHIGVGKILSTGLHPWLSESIVQVRELAHAIRTAYLEVA